MVWQAGIDFAESRARMLRNEADRLQAFADKFEPAPEWFVDRIKSARDEADAWASKVTAKCNCGPDCDWRVK